MYFVGTNQPALYCFHT